MLYTVNYKKGGAINMGEYDDEYDDDDDDDDDDDEDYDDDE